MWTVLPARSLPRIAILAQAGPLAGDLAACLSGRFEVERVTSPAEARGALSRGCRALLLAGSPAEGGTGSRALVEQALGLGCRVLALGSCPSAVTPEISDRVQMLSDWPSPQELVDALRGLENSYRAGGW